VHYVSINGEAGMPAQFQIDEIIAQAQRLRPDQKPGVRMVAGKPNIYDANLLRSFECRELVRSAEGVDLWRDRWVARIQVNKVPIFLGSFRTQEEASAAYGSAARQYFGQFARTA
jgi:hypothetical protein